MFQTSILIMMSLVSLTNTLASVQCRTYVTIHHINTTYSISALNSVTVINTHVANLIFLK